MLLSHAAPVWPKRSETKPHKARATTPARYKRQLFTKLASFRPSRLPDLDPSTFKFTITMAALPVAKNSDGPADVDNKGEVDLVDNSAHELGATIVERNPQTISQALTRHPWTLLWLIYGIWVVMCCSFDNSAGSSVLSIPKFREDFGYLYEGDYVLPAAWQSAFSGGPAASQIVGTFVGGGE